MLEQATAEQEPKERPGETSPESTLTAASGQEGEQPAEQDENLEKVFLVLSEPLKEFYDFVQDLREDTGTTSEDEQLDRITGEMRDKHLNSLTIKDSLDGISDDGLQRLVRIALEIEEPEEFKSILMQPENKDLLDFLKQKVLGGQT